VRCRQMHWGEKCGSANDRITRTIDSLSKRRPAIASRTTDSSTVPSANTTISIVVTNQKLAWWELNRLAAQVHTSMGRGIQPFATISDGDVLFAVTTDEVDNPQLSSRELAIVASEVAWDAILASVPARDPQVSTTAITVDPKTLDDLSGSYELGPGSRMTVARNGAKLTAQSANGGQYIPNAAAVELIPIGRDQFLISGSRHDAIRFERNAKGQVTGLTINPGSWAISASRLAR